MSHIILDDTFNIYQIEDLEYHVQMAFDKAGPVMIAEHSEEEIMKARFRVKIEVEFDESE